MVDYNLRPAVEADFAAIRALIRETRINPMSLDWRRFIVAETRDGQFAGCGQLKPHSDGTIELASLAVAPSARGRGLARRIIEKLSAEAPRPLYLTCRSPLGPFYQKFGFRAVTGSELPVYFRRLSRLAGVITTLRLSKETMLVMVLE